MQNFGTIIDNFDAVTKQYVDDQASAKRIRGIKVDNATLADTAKKVQNAFTYKAHNKAEGTVLPITYDGNRAASLDFSANDFTYDYNSFNNITVKLVNKGYATTAQVNAKYTKPESGIPKSDLATSVQTSLDKADSALQSAPVTSVNGKTGAVQLEASDVSALPTSTKYVVSVNGESGEVKNIAKTNSANTFTGDQTVTGNGSVSGNFTVGGNLTINGTTTTVDSTTLQVKDKLIEVAHGNTATLTTPAGLVAPKYDGTNSGALVFDSTGTAYVGDVTLKDGNIDVANSGLQPLATRTGLVGGNLVQYDSSALTLKDSGKKISDLATTSQVNAKYTKPSGGIPKTDLASDVQTSLGKADSALQAKDISGKANLAGGNTFTGTQTLNSPSTGSGGYSINAAGYIKGSWFQSSATSNKGANTGKVCVFDGDGWIYYRTPAEILAEAGGAKASDIPKLQWVTPTSVSEIVDAIMWKVNGQTLNIHQIYGTGSGAYGTVAVEEQQQNEQGAAYISISKSTNKITVKGALYTDATTSKLVWIEETNISVTLSKWKILKHG